jgi:phospholipase/carboxylesterase
MNLMMQATRTVRMAALALLLSAVQGSAQDVTSPAATQGRVLAHAAPSSVLRPQAAEPTGLHVLSIDSSRAALLYLPAGYRPSRPAPLMVMLHGAGGNPRRVLGFVTSLADSAGIILLAPQSAGMTWDVIRDRYGPDVEFISRALGHVLSHYAVDTTHLAIGGFSDGATYALSLGITNGDLFTHVIAFSPGFMMPAGQRGEPHLFVSHGTKDPILSIDACSRRIVRRVRDAGYDVVYKEFDGGHTVPPSIAREALVWLAGEWSANGKRHGADTSSRASPVRRPVGVSDRSAPRS